jgi:menaquinone-dependent protoporphyrinogen oxidase
LRTGEGMNAAVIYATRQGHTRRVALRITCDLRAHGVDVDVFDAGDGALLDWTKYAAVCLAASVHVGRYEREMVAFVKAHRGELERLSAAFIPVTLTEAAAEDASRPEAERLKASAQVQETVDVFESETGWRPAHVFPVAGALCYSKYNIFVRLIMKQIARKNGAPTDTSRDYEFTDWPALDRFVAGFIAGRLPG